MEPDQQRLPLPHLSYRDELRHDLYGKLVIDRTSLTRIEALPNLVRNIVLAI